MRYRELVDWLSGLTPEATFGYIEWVAGTEWDVDQSVGQTVVLTRIGGDGLSVEGLIDGVGWQVLTIRDQRDYEGGENLALHIDSILRSAHSQRIGDPVTGTWITHARRIGSGPTASYVDDAVRTHFVCSYIVDVGLATAP